MSFQGKFGRRIPAQRKSVESGAAKEKEERDKIIGFDT